MWCLMRNGLMTAADVDDGKAAHAETEIAVDQITAVIRPAVHDAIALPGDGLARDRASTSTVPTGDAAHGLTLRCGWFGRDIHRRP